MAKRELNPVVIDHSVADVEQIYIGRTSSARAGICWLPPSGASPLELGAAH